MHPPGKMAKMTYADDLATSAVAKIFQDIGWHTAHRTALTTMTDMLRDYIRKMSTVAVDFANHNGRSEPTTEDLAMTLKYMNVDVSQLQDYVLNVDSSPLPHKVPFFPVPCKANRAIDNCAPSDEERPECYEEWMPSLVHKRYPSLPELNYQSAEQSQDVLEKQNATSNTSESKAPVFENKSQKNKLVLRFSMSKSVDDLTDENRVHADDEEANEANLSESALIAKRLKKSRAFQNFLNSSLYKNPTDPEAKSALRVADTQRLPNAYQSRENSPQPEQASMQNNDTSNDALNHSSKSEARKAKRSKKKKNSVSDSDNLTFGFFDDDLNGSNRVNDFELKKERKSKNSDSTEERPKKKLMPFSLKVPGIVIADDNANMLDFNEPGPFDFSNKDNLPKTKKQNKPKKEKPPKVLSERKRGRPKKIQSISSTNPMELVFKDGELPLSSSLKTETFPSVFGEEEAAKLLFNLSESNITGDQTSRKRKFDSVENAGADDSMTDANAGSSSKLTTPKKLSRPLKQPKASSNSTKKFVKSAEFIESSGESSDDDDANIDSNPVSLLPPLPEPSMNFRDGSDSPSTRRRRDSVSPMSSNSSLASPFSDFSKQASSSMEHSESSARHKKAEKHSSKVSTLEHLDQLHDSGKLHKEAKHKAKKLKDKDSDKHREEKAHKKHKKDKEKSKKSKESKESKHKEKDNKEKTFKPKLSINLGPDFTIQRAPSDFNDIISESSSSSHTHHPHSVNITPSPTSNEHEFPKYLPTENTAATDFEALKKKRGRKKKTQLAAEGSDTLVFIKNDTPKVLKAPKVKIISTPVPTSLLDHSSQSASSFDKASVSFSGGGGKHSKSRESKTEKERHRKRESSAEKDKSKKEKKSESKSSKDFKIITETIENRSDEVTADQWHCPVCNFPDIGDPMIGCDKCDSWFHYICVGITTPPADDQKWFCFNCRSRKSKSSDGTSKKGKKSSSTVVDNSVTITPIPSIEPISSANLPAQLFSSSSSTSAKPKVTITATSSGGGSYNPTGRPRGRPRKDSYQSKHSVTITALPPLPPPPAPALPTPQPNLSYSASSSSTHQTAPHTKSSQKSTKNRVSFFPADLGLNLSASSSSGSSAALHQQMVVIEDEDEEEAVSNPKMRCGVCRLATSTSYTVSKWVACDECDQWYHFECEKIKEDLGENDSYFCSRCVNKQLTISKIISTKPSH